MAHCIGYGADFPFGRFHEEVEYKMDLSKLVPRVHGQPLPEIDPLLVVLHCAFPSGISPSALTIVRVTATLSFDSVIRPGAIRWWS